MSRYIGFREAYNKGYHDGLKEGIRQTTQKLAREILKDFKVEAKVTPFKGLADDDDGTLPQTDCDKCIWNVCNYNKIDW